MGSGADKNETLMPKAASAAPTKGTVDNLRLQDYPKTDEVHVHDDAKNLVFVWPGIEDFRNTWKEFLAQRHEINVGEEVAFLGSDKDPGSGRKPGDLVLLNEDGIFSFHVEPQDRKLKSRKEFVPNASITLFDDFVNRMIGPH